MRLMGQREENLVKMREFLKDIESNCTFATLNCIPENASTGTMQSMGLRSADSQHWTPELPDRIGIYHAYIRGYNRDVRTHKLFICCSGGLTRASDAFCNVVIDVGQHWTAQEVCDSEEVWWLRKGCFRARCRLIKMLADKFNLKVQTMQVPNEYSLITH